MIEGVKDLFLVNKYMLLAHNNAGSEIVGFYDTVDDAKKRAEQGLEDSWEYSHAAILSVEAGWQVTFAHFEDEPGPMKWWSAENDN